MKQQNTNKENKKDMGLLIALAVVIFVGAIIISIFIINTIKSKANPEMNTVESSSRYTLSGVTNPSQESSGENSDFNQKENTVTDSPEVVPNADNNITASITTTTNTVTDTKTTTADKDNDNKASTINTTKTVTEKVTKEDAQPNKTTTVATITPTTTEKNDAPVKEYEKLSKNGDNVLSDHHDNKYIKTVSRKYGIDTTLLVAIYSEPDVGNNFVLEFSGEKDADGNVIKSPDTLSKVYLVDKKGNISVATGEKEGNVGVSYAEGMLCFNMMKTIVMPQYPDYFTGVEG